MSRRLELTSLIVIACLQTLYAVAFVARSSFVVEGQRYFCLFDDAMISMRHADNWAHGHGLVWNPGERVEGYTNFAWTLVMGLVHLLPLTPSHACLAVQLIGIPVLWLNLWATMRLARTVRLVPLAVVMALGLTACFYSLTHFTLMGMETGLLAAMITLAAADAVSAVRAGRHGLRTFVWLTLAMLLRPDAVVFVMLIAAALIVRGGQTRPRAAAGMLLLVLVVGAHVLWRHHYYGAWLPNTYYLKATGWPLADRWWPGFAQSGRTILWLSIPIVLALFSVLLCMRFERLLAASLLCAAVAYQFYVGGDAWPRDRMIIPAIPALFVLAADGAIRIARGFADGRAGRTIWIALCAAACLVIPNARYGRETILAIAPYGMRQNQENIRYVLALQRTLDPQATVAVGFAGSPPYFSRRHCYDVLGKCDAYIARLPAHPEVRRSGHNKFDFKYTVTQQKPDAIIHVIATAIPEFADAYFPILVTVDHHDRILCVRKESDQWHGGKRVSWDQAAENLGRLKHSLEEQ